MSSSTTPKNNLYLASIVLQKHTTSSEPPVIACMKHFTLPKRVKDARLRPLPHRYEKDDTRIVCACCKDCVSVHFATLLEAMKDGSLIHNPPLMRPSCDDSSDVL